MNATWIIIGKGPSKRWFDESYRFKYPDSITVCTLNDARHSAATLHADLHEGRDDTLRDLEAAGIPVLTHPASRLRTAISFPLEEIANRFGTRYFTHTIPMLIAYALHKGATRLVLPGCDYWPAQDVHMEFAHQRPCAEWWLGFAHGRGVEVIVPKHSFLFTGRDYARGIYALE